MIKVVKKYIILALIILSLGGGIIYLVITRVQFNNSLQSTGNQTTSTTIPATSNNYLEDRIRVLETAVTYLLKQKGQTSLNISEASQVLDPTLETRLKLLETTVAELKSRPTPGQTPGSAPTTVKPPIYIPLAGDTNFNDKNGLVLDQFEVQIDPSEYSGYSNMILEADLRLTQKIGTAYLSLYNLTDNSGIQNSEVSTTSDKFSLNTSGTFKLPAGKKTYRLRVKSSEGTEALLSFARIKVVF